MNGEMAPYFTKRHDLGTFFHGRNVFTLQKWLKVHCRQIRAAMCESALVWHKCFVPSDAGTYGSAFWSFSLRGQDLVSNHHPVMVEFPRSRLGGTLRCGEDELCFG